MKFSYRHIPLEPQEDFASRASAELEQTINDSIDSKGRCTIGFSGGSTPRPIYQALGELVAVEWEKVTIFLVDERYVSADDEHSNQKLINDTLLSSVAGKCILTENIIFPDTSLPLEECIEDYDFRIDQLMEQGIDIVTLGLGEDGHIASLFPNDTKAINENGQRVIHTTTDRFDVADRITVTFPVLTSASHQLFFLKGKEKEEIFHAMLMADDDPLEYPAHTLLATGKTTWVTQW